MEITSSPAIKRPHETALHELDEASRTKNKKIAWCSSARPAELAMSARLFGLIIRKIMPPCCGSTRTAMFIFP